MGNGDSSGLYKLTGELGKGSYGVVYKAERRSDGKILAIKTIKADKISPALMARTLEEVRLLASINHPNIIGFESSYYNSKAQSLCIVTEYAEKGDLQHKINEHKKHQRRIPESVVWRVLLHVSRGLKYLHQNKIIHRDLKAANIFQSADGTYKIGDLNLSKFMGDKSKAQTRLGTPLYLSPEIWSNQQYGTQSDLWALGVLAYELTMMKNPFLGKTVKEIKHKVFQEKPARIRSQYSPLLSDTVDRLLSIDPMKRPNAEEIAELAHRIMRTYYSQPDLKSTEQENEVEMLKTIVLPPNKNKWDLMLPKQRPERHLEPIRRHSLDSRGNKAPTDQAESESTRENISALLAPGEERIGSAIQACRKGKPNGGRAKLLPIFNNDKQNVNPNLPNNVCAQR